MERGDASRPESLGSHLSDRYPLRVHWTDPGHEDKAAAALEAAELAWEVQVDELGFAEPVLPDSHDGPELDIYLADLDPWEGWAWAPVQEDFQEGDGRMGAPAYVAFDRDVPDEWLASYVAHEFNHVLQYATDFTEEAVTPWEATATAAQRWTLDDGGQWDFDVPDFQVVPWAPTLVGDSYELWDRFGVDGYYEYGAALWVVALDEAYGDGSGSMGAWLWDAAAQEGDDTEPDFVDAVAELAGSLAEAMNVIAEARWATDPRPPHQTVASLPAVVVPETPVLVLGQLFVQVLADVDPADLVVDVVSDNGYELAVTLLQDDAGPVIAVTNLGPVGWDGDDDPWSAAGLELTLDRTVPDEEPPDGTACSCSADESRSASLPLVLATLLLARRRTS